MKFEQLYIFIKFIFNFKFIYIFKFIFLSFFNFIHLNYLFQWKISNYADSYWFFYSNKKSIHELRYISK
jgi:hypothetical protein